MLTQWIQKIISMLLVMSAVLQVIPGKDYEKYIRFFCGLVLILLVLSPVAALKGLKVEQFYQKEVYQQYEKEIIELKEKGLSQSEIAERLGFTKEQVKGFIKRLHRKERRTAAGEILKKKGRPPKDDRFSNTDKVNELKYIIARKEASFLQSFIR